INSTCLPPAFLHERPPGTCSSSAWPSSVTSSTSVFTCSFATICVWSWLGATLGFSLLSDIVFLPVCCWLLKVHRLFYMCILHTIMIGESDSANIFWAIVVTTLEGE